jgi:hypothetical protein
MKKGAFVLLAFFLGLAGFVSAEERGGGRGFSSFSGASGDSGVGGGFSNSSGYSGDSGRRGNSVSPKLRSLGIRSVPRYFTQRSQLLSAGSASHLGLPSQGPRGEAFRAAVVSPRAMNSTLVRNNMAVVNRAGFRSQVHSFNARETTVGRYYWHNFNGVNFCHYYDRWGCHWYGWYCGSSFYWSCWWGNFWWWYDPLYFRWCYWYDGWWWWQNPEDINQIDVYNNGEYVPSGSEETQGSKEVQSPAAKATSQIQTFNSKDGTRMVKVVGESKDAFLYDMQDPPAFKARYLVSGVTDVRFSKTTDGKPLQIILVLSDDSFELFDADGNPVGNH